MGEQKKRGRKKKLLDYKGNFQLPFRSLKNNAVVKCTNTHQQSQKTKKHTRQKIHVILMVQKKIK